MVNRGPSTGCWTCRERRVKCDEEKPRCQQCTRHGHQCVGWGKRPAQLKFKDQGAKLLCPRPSRQQSSKSSQLVPKASADTIPSSLSPKDDDVAGYFVLRHLAGLGRSSESSRGFLELLPLMISSERQDSPFCIAFSAVATKLWAILKDPMTTFDSPHQPFTHALKRLRRATQDPVESGRDGTIMAALVLQFYEDLAARANRIKTPRTHFGGAVNLIKLQDPSKSRYRGNLLGYVIYSELLVFLQDGKKLASHTDWIPPDALRTIPTNPSSRLDTIGLSVAHHWQQLSELMCYKETESSATIESRLDSILDLEARLEEWPNTVPDYWHPRGILSGLDVDLTVETYLGLCEVYPTVQIATIWNAWRNYRLIILQIKCVLLERYPIEFTDYMGNSVNLNCGAASTIQRSSYMKQIQSLIDSICYTIPFYLGNRYKLCRLWDYMDPAILAPSYHDLRGDAYATYAKSSHFMSKQDYQAHVIMQGPSHALTCLADLLVLLTRHDAILMMALRAGQGEWIRAQYLRARELLQLC